LGRAIGTNPEAKLTTYAFILVNQSYTSCDIFIKGGAGAGFNTRRIKAMHARKWLEILVDLIIMHLGSNLIYSD